ncbi:MAG: hypothetical protein M3352_11995 [Bacteroidota bacterium]|nr:hypothetical protein [Bacteroidota bacterium]
MKKIFYLILSIFFVSLNLQAYSQGIVDRLKIFVDCSNLRCDHTFFRSEVTVVDFLLDNKAADVHILITEQNTGGGGDQYQLIFFGQNSFKNMSDTIRFNTDANATDFEERDLLIKYLKLGLGPYIAKTASAKDVVMDFKKSGVVTNNKDATPATKDPWNYWVLRVGINGNLSADEVYKSNRYNANYSANRKTELNNVGFNGNISRRNESYEFVDSNGITTITTVKNHSYNFEHYYLIGINNHWTYGYAAELSRSTFNNMKQNINLKAAIEYNIFPYSAVNNKFFALRYFLDVRKIHYFDTTLFNKIRETLYGHGAETRMSFNQKWGTTSFGLEYHNYFHNWKLFNLEANAEVDVRITGGLTFNVYASAELVRDQLSLPKEGATEREVLTRRRQLASGYNYFISFGLNYRFGSKLNNFVNPRFGPN